MVWSNGISWQAQNGKDEGLTVLQTGRKVRFAMRRKQHIVIVSGWDEELKTQILKLLF